MSLRAFAVLLPFALAASLGSASAQDRPFYVICKDIGLDVPADFHDSFVGVETIEIDATQPGSMIFGSLMDAKGEVMENGHAEYRAFARDGRVPLTSTSRILGLFAEIDPFSKQVRLVHQWDYHDADQRVVPLTSCSYVR